MKILKRLLLSVLLGAICMPLLVLPSGASADERVFSEDFESFFAGDVYPASKLWVTTALFTLKREADNRYLHMPFCEVNKDAAICPFGGSVTPTQKGLLVSMDLRPVYRASNAVAQYDFRVRKYTYTDENGNEASDKWKSFFSLYVESEAQCYLSNFSGVPSARIPLTHGEWNTVTVSFDLVTGSYAVSSGEAFVQGDLGLSNLGFQGNQLQFNNLIKGCTYAATEEEASYVDIDNIRLSPPADVSRFEGMLRSVGTTAIRLDSTTREDATAAGIRFITEVRTDLFDELMRMRESGEIISLRVGTLISPTDYLSGEPLTRQLNPTAYVDVEAQCGVFYSRKADAKTAQLAGSILNIREKNLGRTFTARAYVDVVLATGQHFTVYASPMEACTKELANAALADGEGYTSEQRDALRFYGGAPRFSVGESLRMMSYNVYYSDLREERMDLVVDMIKKHSPDVIGLQEATEEDWKPHLLEHLGSDYGYVGHGREEGGAGEGTPILYRKDRFTLIMGGTRWLSDTPTVCSKYDASRQNRIFTYAILSRNSDGKQFVFINTHLDTKSAEARLLQIASLKRQIVELGLDLYPMLLTGDMNCLRSSEDGEIGQILSAGFSDAMDLAVRRSATPMKNGESSMIDFCFVQKKYAFVMTYLVDRTRFDGEAPSDHDPVVVDVRFQ